MKKFFLFSVIGLIGAVLTSCGDDTDSSSKIKTETNITYTITISPDLLKFVTPQVRYIDENGNLITLTGIEDLDGKVIESKAEIKNGDSFASAWSSQVITGTGYKCWTIQMKFNRLNFHTYMGVRYVRNDFIEDTNGKAYDFHHNVNTAVNIVKSEGTSIKAYSDSYVSITVGNYKKGDDIESYLNELYSTPDKVGYYIDNDGNASRNDEFNMN